VLVATQLPSMDRPLDTAQIHRVGPSTAAEVNNDFVVAPASARVAFSSPKVGGMNVVGVSGAAYGAAAMAVPAGSPPAPVKIIEPPKEDNRMIVHCRFGAGNCDLGARDSNGSTALYRFATALRVDEVRALLDAGADPWKPGMPNGEAPLDTIAQRLRSYPAGTDSAKAAGEIHAMLAARPRPPPKEKPAGCERLGFRN